VAVATRHLCGRDEQLASLVALLDAPDRLPATAVIIGEAGIGKTAIWLAAVEEARARRFAVLSCRPSEAEARFSFSGLADLLGGIPDAVLRELPVRQRRALDTALALADAEEVVEEGVLAFAFVRVLRSLAEEATVLLAIDDVQWLDAPSLALLRYALRRLESEHVAALVTARGEGPAWLRRDLPAERVLEVELGPLSVGALHRLLQDRLGMRFPRPVLLRIWETSSGNPFFALELARALQRRGGRVEPGTQLPLSPALEALVQERIDGLGSDARAVALVVAAHAEPSVAVVEAAAGHRGAPGVVEALEAGVLELEGERLRFTHSLLASAVLARTPPAERRRLHARLAEVVPGAEARARHLALAVVGPDPIVAVELENAARQARARGAPAGAAELAEQALRLTPPDDGRAVRRRSVDAADHLFAAGDTERAITLLEDALACAAPGPERASILHRLGTVLTHARGPRDGIALLEEALVHTGGDHALEAAIELELADTLRFSTGALSAEPHAVAAVHAAERARDEAIRCGALAVFGLIHFRLGRGIDREAMARAVALQESLALPPAMWSPKLLLCDQLFWSHDLVGARQLAEELRDAARRADGRHEGDRPGLPFVSGVASSFVSEALAEPEPIFYLALIEWRAGNWRRAAELADEARALDEESGRDGLAAVVEWPRTLIAAHRGLVDEAREHARRAVADAEGTGIGAAVAGYRWVLGFIELSEGDPAAALTHLRVARVAREAVGYGEPGQMWELPDLLDALVAVGELDEAEAIAVATEERARALDRAWALALSARTRAVVAAARGDVDGALAAFEEALADHARTDDPFQHARTLLALGTTQRRAKRRGAARATLEQALAAFDELGAPLWADKTRAELARIGGRAPARGALTESERRIAALVAEGRTNREVATALFVTEHTVATALTRIYGKLGVRSRAELASRLPHEKQDSTRANT
jgi:DNA-binding CsgD family transcriptional regulator